MRKNNARMRVASALLFMVVANLAQAQAPAPADDVALYGQLAVSQSNRLLFTSQAATETALKALNDSRSAASGSPLSDTNTVPKMRSIFAPNDVPHALFVYPGNISVEAGVGDKLPGGCSVSHLWAEKMSGELLCAGKVVPIGMSGVVAQEPTNEQRGGLMRPNFGVPPVQIPSIMQPR